jgi:hypothetical protein
VSDGAGHGVDRGSSRAGLRISSVIIAIFLHEVSFSGGSVLLLLRVN